jgi:hypothetical protein
MTLNVNAIRNFLHEHLYKISGDTLGWLAVIVIHCATIPSLLALLTGLSDKTPGIDIIMFMWAGLILMFAKAIVLKDSLTIITIGIGFIIQASLMALILFK